MMSMLSRACFSVWVVAQLCFVVSCGGPDIEQSLGNARDSLEFSDYATARIHLQNVLQADSRHQEARSLLARVAVYYGDLESARELLEGLRSAGASEDLYAVTLAEVYVGAGQPEQAMDLLAGAIGDSTRAWLIRADAERLLGAFDDSDAALARARELGAGPAEVDIRLARNALRRGESANARQLIAAVLERFPAQPEALLLRASDRLSNNDRAGAADDLKAAAEAFLEDGRVLQAGAQLLALVELQLGLGEVESAGEASSQLSAVLPDTMISHYAAALVAFREKRFADVVSELTPALANAPEERRFLLLAGAARLALGSPAQAEQMFITALNMERSDAAALRLLVQTRLRQDRPRAAIEALRAYPDAVADEDSVLAGLEGQAHLLLDDPEAAIPVLERALESNPDNQAIALQLIEANVRAGYGDRANTLLSRMPQVAAEAEVTANIRLMLARYAEGGADAAENYLEELEQQRSADAVFKLTSSLYYLVTQDLDRSMVEINQALELEPDFVPAMMMRGGLLQRMGDLDNARNAYQSAVELEPGNTAALSALAVLAVGQEDFREAATLFNRAFQASGNWQYLANEARTVRMLEDSEWAAGLEAWLLENPDNLEVRMYLAEQHLIDGNADAAVATYQDVLAIDRNNLAALNNAAWLLSQQDSDSALALEYSRAAARLAPENGAVLDTLGWLLVQQGQPAEALRHLELATQLIPDDPQIQYHLAVSQRDSGDREAAQRTLDLILAGPIPEDMQGDIERLQDSL